MAMLGYFDVFPHKSRTELRTATIQPRDATDPFTGHYVFTEFFCTDPKCDCQRVLVKVYRAESEKSRPEDVAAISYTWNPNGNADWSIVLSETPNPFLDPLHPKAPYADELLEFWTTMLEHDEAYALRLQRHYDEIRAKVGQKSNTREPYRRSKPAAHAHASSSSTRTLKKKRRKAAKQRAARTRKRK